MFRRKKNSTSLPAVAEDKDEKIKHLSAINTMKQELIDMKDKEIKQLKERLQWEIARNEDFS